MAMPNSSDGDIAIVTKLAEGFLRVINESLAIANRSRNLSTRDSRLRVAKDTLERLFELAASYPYVKIVGLDEFETSLRNVQAETELLRSKRQMRPGLDMAEANAARLATFRKMDDILLGVRQISTLDSHTCIICIAYEGAEWDLEGNPINGTVLPFNDGPPRHYACRSVLVGISNNAILRNRKGTRASDQGQIDRKTTFDQFLQMKTVTYQNDMLGEGRAELWRQGRIRCRDLLDERGHILSLKELEARYPAQTPPS